MKCERTAEMLAAHLDAGNESPGGASQDQRDEALRAHLAGCADCREELAGLEAVQASLAHWRDQPVPEWDRRSVLQGADGRDSRGWSRAAAWLSRWQWAPLAASLVLALAVVFNVQVERSADGFMLTFGSTAPGLETAQIQEQLQDELAAFARQQRQQREQELQVAFERFAGNAADNFEQLVSWVEQQREQDLQMLEASFLEMLEREQQTVQSMQQLATYVQYQGVLR